MYFVIIIPLYNLLLHLIDQSSCYWNNRMSLYFDKESGGGKRNNAEIITVGCSCKISLLYNEYDAYTLKRY